jgi:hypothetical protein
MHGIKKGKPGLLIHLLKMGESFATQMDEPNNNVHHHNHHQNKGFQRLHLPLSSGRTGKGENPL